MALQTRFVADSPSDTDAWIRAAFTGFLNPPAIPQESLDQRRARQDFSRARGTFDGDRCVATFRSFDQRLTVVGGGTIAANAISGVTVTATHRRRGLLSRMMRDDLAEARERGDVAATLIAAEYPIYGRFGFGPATSFVDWKVNGLRTGLDPRWSLPESEGSLAFVDGAEVRKVGPDLHERFRLGQPGAIDRKALFWERETGEVRFAPDPWEEPFHVLHRDAAGVPQGLVTFTTNDDWEAGMPNNTATVRDLFATSPDAERALWRFLLSVDWVSTVSAVCAAPDSVLPSMLPNRRAAAVARSADFLWLRPLDLPKLLGARTYATEGELVLDVRDPLGLTQGRYLLSAAREGGEARPTTREPDLTLGTGALGQLYLGEVTAARLLASGELSEDSERAAARADLLFHTGRRPWCPDIF
ncbi:GNAT family N-acetyltransferase [Streptomyces litchfieldiae]|uniref:GNAT family N-acetyltransferase n=1 Tax=Streptomyces litchfieldiae TaxID=3075543 RepID=A0ABU2MP14_9ACTN|nr:GNAT family N-acetyltransferase [Streptomyces sp. DSM 44938]MDT0343372.1 GNAT family N-acetyltransferase [Streptomyces sp. DSM 44938]